MAAPDDPDGIKLFGTGGQLLAELKRLLGNVAGNLRNLELTDLMLDRYEAKHLLDEVLQSGQLILRRLSVVNVTTSHCPIMHVGLFFNLETLVISPQNIDDDVLLLFADSRLRHLHILQNCYTPSHRRLEPCSARAWRILKRDNPKLMVHLRVESLAQGTVLPETSPNTNNNTTEFSEILWQPEAPVQSVLYKASARQMTKSGSVIRALDLYKTTLTVYGHELLSTDTEEADNEVAVNSSPTTLATEGDEVQLHKGLKSLALEDGVRTATADPEALSTNLTPWLHFDNRIDSVLVLLARQAPNLSVLLVKDPVSTATLLLIAKAAINLRHLYVLKDAVQCVCDWPPSPEWSSEFYEWLCVSSGSLAATEQEIGRLLGRNWQMLDRESYNKVHVDPRRWEE